MKMEMDGVLEVRWWCKPSTQATIEVVVVLGSAVWRRCLRHGRQKVELTEEKRGRLFKLTTCAQGSHCNSHCLGHLEGRQGRGGAGKGTGCGVVRDRKGKTWVLKGEV